MYSANFLLPTEGDLICDIKRRRGSQPGAHISMSMVIFILLAGNELDTFVSSITSARVWSQSRWIKQESSLLSPMKFLRAMTSTARSLNADSTTSQVISQYIQVMPSLSNPGLVGYEKTLILHLLSLLPPYYTLATISH
jgi:hypothetical protein